MVRVVGRGAGATSSRTQSPSLARMEALAERERWLTSASRAPSVARAIFSPRRV